MFPAKKIQESGAVIQSALQRVFSSFQDENPFTSAREAPQFGLLNKPFAVSFSCSAEKGEANLTLLCAGALFRETWETLDFQHKSLFANSFFKEQVPAPFEKAEDGIPKAVRLADGALVPLLTRVDSAEFSQQTSAKKQKRESEQTTR